MPEINARQEAEKHSLRLIERMVALGIEFEEDLSDCEFYVSTFQDRGVIFEVSMPVLQQLVNLAEGRRGFNASG